MKRPYFSILFAVIFGLMTAFFMLMFLFARGPGDALAPLFATIWAVVFGIPFGLFMVRIIRFNRRQTQSRYGRERNDL